MEKFKEILKGSPWENVSEYLYISLKSLSNAENYNFVFDSIKNKIEMCSLLLDYYNNPFIHDALIDAYKKWRYPVSTQEASAMLNMGIDDKWLRDFFINEEQNGGELYIINYYFVRRHIEEHVAEFYVEDLCDKYDWPDGNDEKKDIRATMSFLNTILELLPKGTHNRNDKKNQAIEFFFERKIYRFDIFKLPELEISYISNNVSFFTPLVGGNHIYWYLYFPNTNEEYRTIYRCLDYFNYIDDDLKQSWIKLGKDEQTEGCTLVKAMVRRLKKKKQ